MRNILIMATLLAGTISGNAQQNQGRIIFERTSKVNIQVSDPAFANMIPPERKDKFELHYADNKVLWRPAEEAQEPEMNFTNGAGAQMRIVVPGSNDMMFADLPAKRKVEQREIFNRTFVVEDSIRSNNWKISQETKTVLGFTCRKATTQRTQQAMRMNMDNGVMKREAVTDTLEIVAWFTDAIPVFTGPENYQAQLPGAILELDINKGRTHFQALSVTADPEIKSIREPKGKKMTAQEFTVEREKMMKEMEKNGGGSFNIRVGG